MIATLLIVTIAAGVLFYNTIMGSVTSMTNNLNTQMALLLIEGTGINSTTITAFIRNTGQFSVEILNAYVNSQIALLAQTVNLASAALGVTYIKGEFSRGSTYSVQLAGMFGTLTIFQVTY